MKRILTIVLAVVLVAAIAVGGTMAYLQDSASDVNVMTLGNVDIEQNEEQRVDPAKNGTLTAADLENFVQGKALLPYVDENLNNAMKDDYEEITFPNGKTHKLFVGDNAIDKFVSVTNTGKSDAYVRTIIALEAPTDKIDLSFNSTDWTMDKIASSYSIEVNGVKYDLFVCYYKQVLKPEETTPYSLMQIILDNTATNEETEIFGSVYDVLVLSQAVQTNGFADAQTALDTAFGVVDADNAADWFGADEFVAPTAVATASELAAALAAGESVYLTEDVDLGETQITIPAGKTATLNLNGHDIDAVQNGTTTYGTFNVAAGATLNVEGNGDVTVKTNVTSGISACLFQNDGTLNIYGGNFEANQATSVAGLQAVIAVIDNCPYNSNAVVNIYGGTFAVTGLGASNVIRNWPIHADGVATLNIYGGTIKANPERTTTYLWNKDDSTPTTLNSFMNFYGGIYETGVVYEDYNGQNDIYIAPGVNVAAYSGNN